MRGKASEAGRPLRVKIARTPSRRPGNPYLLEGTHGRTGELVMTQSLELPVQEFCLDWTLTGDEGGRVGVTLSGQVSLLDNNRFYKIDGVVYVTEGEADIRAVGNP